MNLHYSLFKVVDAAGITHILSLAEIRGIEFCREHNHCQVRSGGAFPIDINPYDGDRLLDAWNKYKQIYHASRLRHLESALDDAKSVFRCMEIDYFFSEFTGISKLSELSTETPPDAHLG